MPAATVPDFAAIVPGESFDLYRTYSGGAYVVVPDHLEVASRSDGRPGLCLEMVRGERPSLPPEPHGRLWIRFQPAFPREEALARARQNDPRATVRLARVSRARVRFRVGSEVKQWPEHLTGVHDLIDDGRGQFILDVLLSLDDATAVRRFLEADRLSVDAVLDADVNGVPPRVGVSVTFDPAELIGALKERGVDRYNAIRSALRESLFGGTPLPLSVRADLPPAQRNDYAAAVTARLYRQYGQPLGATDTDEQPRVAWDDAVPSGHVTWDLSESIVAPLPFTFTADPFAAARQEVEERGIDAVSPTRIAPSLESGQHRVSVIANLPALRPSVIEAGVELEVPAKPPFRLQTQHRVVVFTPPDDRGNAVFRFSPLDEPEVQVRPYLMIRREGGAHRYAAEPWSTDADRLQVRPSDFPGTFLPIEAGASLLRIAEVAVACRYRQAGVDADAEVRLTPDAPESAMTLPPGSEVKDLVVRIRPREDLPGSSIAERQEVRVEGVPADIGLIDLSLFPEYGPHTIRVSCPVSSGGLFALDIRPEGRADEGSVLHFTEGRSSREWSWVAESPFRPGYEYRSHDAPDGIGWTHVASPFQDLVLQPHV